MPGHGPIGVFAMALLAAVAPLEPADYAADAASIEPLINAQYAYLDRLPAGRFRLSPKLRAEAAQVSDGPGLVRFGERALMLLADHHAITGASRKDSWAVFPTFGDLWVESGADGVLVTAVRQSSPASGAGIRPGDRILDVDGVPIATAMGSFWTDLGARGGGFRDGFAARVLVAGRRDRARRLTVQRGRAPARRLELPSLYSVDRPKRASVSLNRSGGAYVIRINDSLGDQNTVAAFDSAMAQVPRGRTLVIDLTDTPSGGNTVVARAILGWFVDRPTAYQVHRLPAEERRTGIARQWVEQVLPRTGKRWRGNPRILVGRWTGSMGEGLAVGFDHLGAAVEGGPMAGLLGAVYDHRLERSGQILKLPTERLSAVDGTAREHFRPGPADSRR